MVGVHFCCDIMVNNFFLGGEVLEILISYHSKVPIYEQIFKQISNKILSGELPPGASLPAIRVLAKDLGVSIITVKKATALQEASRSLARSKLIGGHSAGGLDGLK